MQESTIASYDLRYGTHRFQTPDGTELYYEVRGSGPVIVIINNFFVIAPLWRNFTQTLEKSHTLVSFDLRNQGASAQIEGKLTFESLVDDVEHLLNHLELASCYLVGTSTSTLIARDFALQHPQRVKGMVLVGPLFCPYGSRRRKFLTKSWLATLDKGGVAGLFGHIFPLIYSDRTIENGGTPAYLALRERFCAVNSQQQLEQFLEASLTTNDAPDKLKNLPMPVRLLVGEADFLQSSSSLAAAVGLLPAGELDVVPHAGHVPYFEATEHFEKAIAEVVQAVEGRMAREPATSSSAHVNAATASAATASPATASPADADGGLFESLRRSSSLHAERPALSVGGETWSYAKLGRAVSSLADQLSTTTGPILYTPRNTPLGVATILAAVAARVVPILPDPTWTEHELRDVVRRCGVRAVIGEKPRNVDWLGQPQHMDGLHLQQVSLNQEDVSPRRTTAFCRFTSGTTGTSRCLEFSESAAMAAALSWQRAAGYGQQDVVCCLATLNNGLAFNTSLLAVLLTGGHLVFHPGPLLPGALAKTFERFEPTVLVAFPFVYDALAKRKTALPAPRLRLALSSAAPLARDSAEAFRSRYGMGICNYYGLVEAGPCTFNDASTDGCLGVPLEGVELRIQDGENAGRLLVRSASMASGYLDRAGPAFDSNLDDDGYYVTSDLAELDEAGRLYLRGRLGRLINIEGRKVDPLELENLIRNVEGVTDALVREESANGRRLIAAYVEGAGLEQHRLLEAFCQRLAPYKRPQRVHVLPTFPRSAAGKILMNQLLPGEL